MGFERQFLRLYPILLDNFLTKFVIGRSPQRLLLTFSIQK